MITDLYRSPTRVYTLLSLLAILGIFCGWKLPVSLFPNSSKPDLYISVDYGGLNASEFQRDYGDALEDQLRTLNGSGYKLDRVITHYNPSSVSFQVLMDWGSDPQISKKEVERTVNAWSARLSNVMRESVGVWLNNDNSGFFAASFYSETRSLDDIFDILEANMKAQITAVPDAEEPQFWNPHRKEVRIELKPSAMANLRLYPKDIEQAVQTSLVGRDGGYLTVAANQLRVQMPRHAQSVEELANILIVTPSGKTLHLRDIATIDLGPQMQSTRILKTSGAPSIILYSAPKPGGNIKAMSEDFIRIIEATKKQLPADIQYKILVDPSLFIRSSIQNVFHEVIIGSLLAVSVLFIFIGSLRNVVTAAIEIPLSLVLAFILMWIFGLNLNLISLGGLALSAGMNVDASVVVMENIFRYFEKYKGQAVTYLEKAKIITEAVAEVRLPIIASTIASLVVFVPLMLTSDLSYAILGDLAKAVIFSHGFSSVVALLLVPTVRLHLMKNEPVIRPHETFFEPMLRRIENTYRSALSRFIETPKTKLITYTAVAGALLLLILLVLPRLPREVIGKPDSDMIFISASTQGNSLVRQMEFTTDEIERSLLTQFSKDIQYTFTQVTSPNGAWILARLKDKSAMTRIWKEMEKHFVNTPQLKFEVEPWNPSELPIPNPPDLLIGVHGGDLKKRRDLALSLQDLLETGKFFPRVWSEPNVERKRALRLTPHWNQWSFLNSAHFSFLDLVDVSRVATVGRKIGEMPIKNRKTVINMRYPLQYVENVEDLKALPVAIDTKMVPFKSLMDFNLEEMDPPLYRENSQDVYFIHARRQMSEKYVNEKSKKAAIDAIDNWRKDHGQSAEASDNPTVLIEEAGRDVATAISQLEFAIGASIVLILVVLVLQFGSFAESMVILVAIPLGFLGVIASLFAFGSSLSLNSALGVILLNGIAVNNSIILVDFMKRLWQQGASPLEAALEAATKRLRPILITSLTTVLGMLPIALGFGEGGKILQPLGIAVSGGLWISMSLTLFIVPALYVSLLKLKKREVAHDVA